MWPDPSVSRQLLLQSVVVDEATIPPDMTIAEWRIRRVPVHERPIDRKRRRLSHAMSVATRWLEA
jgi:hypothetical protein